jgi:hypothetical protein
MEFDCCDFCTPKDKFCEYCEKGIEEQVKPYFKKHKNDWVTCRQTRWDNGSRVEHEELYNGNHRINVTALGIHLTSVEVPSYAGATEYEIWVKEIEANYGAL